MNGRNGHAIARQTLRDTLVTIPSIQTLVAIEGTIPTQYKVLWEHVHDDFAPPYITLHHFSGGYERDRRYYDGIWEVKGHVASMAVADAMEEALDKLDYMWPVTTTYPQVCGYDTVDNMLPMFNRYVVKNNSLFVVAGLYRLRLNLGEIV